MTQRISLDAIADVHAGTSIDRKQRAEAGIPVFGFDQLAGRRGDLPPCIPPDVLPARATRLRTGDVVIATIGKAGRSAVIGTEYEDAVLDRECAVIRLRDPDGPITAEWLHLWVRSSDARAQMNAKAAGSTIPRIPVRQLRELQVPVPQREVQLRSTRQLRRLDTALAATCDTLAILEQLQRTEIDLCMQDVDFPGSTEHLAPSTPEEGNPASRRRRAAGRRA